MKMMMNEYEYDDSDGDSDDYSYVDNDEYFIRIDYWCNLNNLKYKSYYICDLVINYTVKRWERV
jgi:hypothetical protein